MKGFFAFPVLLGVSLLLSACNAAPSGGSDPLADGGNPDDWPAPGRTYGEQHYSPLEQVNQDTVGRLGLAWSLDLDPAFTLTQPIVVDGTIYFATGYSVIHAVDGVTGKLLWKFDPEVYKTAGASMLISWGSRGISWWNGKIYTVTKDGQLIAVDAKTGKKAWSVSANPDGSIAYFTGAPRVFDGKVIVGSSGDNGKIRGFATVFDAESGKQLWRFWVVPGNPADGFESEAMEMAAKTWSGKWWEKGGGGTPWNAFTYDPETDTVFIGTGNGFPYNHRLRSEGKGDNLFLSSVVALDADTGKYKWHYQTTPADTWDFTAVQDLELADLTIDGKPRKVLLTAPKNGFFYVIDRVTGELLSAKPFAKATWASHVDMKTGRPVEAPGARYQDKPFEGWPSTLGAHNIQPMAHSPQTGLTYIPTFQWGARFSDNTATTRWNPPKEITTGLSVMFGLKTDDPNEGTSALVAWDPVAQKEVWRVKAPRMAPAGVMATGGGLVFQGTIDDRFNAYSARDGKLLWSFDAKAPPMSPPVTYSVGGKQYVTVITGMSGAVATWGTMFQSYGIDYRTMARRVLTFALDGKAALPPKTPVDRSKPADPGYRADAASASAGQTAYLVNGCVNCHGYQAVAAGAAPDLRRSSIVLSPETFAEVVRKGMLAPNGMPKYDHLTDRQLADLRQYIRAQAHDPKLEKDTTALGMGAVY